MCKSCDPWGCGYIFCQNEYAFVDICLLLKIFDDWIDENWIHDDMIDYN